MEHEDYDLPIENSISERPSGASTSQEQVPYSVREGFSLAIGSKADRSSSTSKTDSQDFAQRLTSLYIGC